MRRDMAGWRGRGALALVLLVVVSSFVIAPAFVPAGPRSAPVLAPVKASATTVTARAYYADSSYLEVNWSESQDSCFYNYTFWLSTDTGVSWTGYSITNKAATQGIFNGFSAGNVLYWKVTDEDCSRANATSATYVVTMPYAGHLSSSWVNDTAVHLSWGNNYTYGGQGNLSFIGSAVVYLNNGTAIGYRTNLADRNYTFNAAAGTYSLEIWTADTCTICSPYNPNIGNSNIVTVTTTAPVTDSASAAPTTGEAKVPIAFTCSASSGVGPYTYAWAFGDGQTGSGPSVSHTYTTSGNMDAVCTAKDAHNGTATSHVAVTVNPALAVAAAPSSTSIAPGSAVVFNATVTGGTGGPYTITWNFGDGSSGTGALATHTYTTPGTYIPTVTVTDALGGTTTQQLASITVAAPNSGLGDLALFGGIGAIVIVAVALLAFLMLRKRKGGPQNPPGTTPPPSP